MGKKGSKRGQNEVFDFFLKNGSKDFSDFWSEVKAIQGLHFGRITFLKKKIQKWVKWAKRLRIFSKKSQKNVIVFLCELSDSEHE